MDAVTLEVEVRTTFGKKNRALRRQGITPVHMYGSTKIRSLSSPKKRSACPLSYCRATTPITLSLLTVKTQ
ncbi:MAG: hypothetical protein Ct9H300mP19_07990 [Dehalococcoidia bacterium]|nr:MAG: hypothetical protein Ct9H300mP19_07990 [Dehalococcoidia bacterium]